MPEGAWRAWGMAVVWRALLVAAVMGAAILPATLPQNRSVQVAVLVEPRGDAAATGVRRRLVDASGDRIELQIDADVEDMRSSLRDALWRADATRRNAVVIAGSGHWHPSLSTALQQARAANLPVYWLPADDRVSLPRIGGVVAPAMARPGEAIGISVNIEVTEPVDLRLLADGQAVAIKTVSQSGPVPFEFDAPAAGMLLLGAELVRPGTTDVIDRLEQGTVVNVSAPPAILVVANDRSLFGESLQRGGWDVTAMTPGQLGGFVDSLPTYAGIVLDDIRIDDMPDTVWSRLTAAVRRDAVGLLVLGGASAFGLGAYRGSELETLLPVIAEPPVDEVPASVLFLVDVSGSMDRAAVATERLRIARRAVMETAASLRPVDRVGLMTFDVDVSERLALDARDDHPQAIERAWPAVASGGTRLLPALRHARDAFRGEDAGQQLIVLLTDGYLAADDVAQIDNELGDGDVILIGIVIDDGRRTGTDTLSGLPTNDRLRLLRIDDVLRLPVLMRSELEATRPAVVTGPSTVSRTNTAFPSLPASWPPVAAYALTRPRADATVHLQSARGDVILATGQAGAGRVAVLTSGFSGWTADWLQWPEWPAAAASLAGFVAAGTNGEPSITVHDGGERLVIDFAADGAIDPVPVASIVDPAGATRTLPLERLAPGAFATRPALDGYGLHTVSVSHGDSRSRMRFLRSPANAPGPSTRPIAVRWVEEGLLLRWTPDTWRSLDRASLRQWLSGLAFAALLLLLVVERWRPDWRRVWAHYVK